MMSILVTTLWILLGFMLLVFLLLAVPVEFAFEVEQDRARKSNAMFVLLFGLVKIPLHPRAWPKKKKRTNHGDSGEREENKSGKSKFRLIRNSNFRRPLIRSIRRLLNCVRIHDFDLYMRIGLDDPADTGQLWGIIGPIAGPLTCCGNTSVQIIPDFTNEVFFGYCRGRFRVVPLRLISVAAAFILNPKVVYAWAFGK